jgi:hypothetical protein
VEYVSVLDWNYVIVEQYQDISKHRNYASIKIHDQKELFKYLNQFNVMIGNVSLY